MSSAPQPGHDPSTVLESPKPKGLFDHLAGLYLSPGDAFRSLTRRPAPLAPLVLLVLVNVAFMGTWLSQVSFPEFVKHMIEQSPQAGRIPPEKMGEVVEMQVKIMKVMMPVSALVAAPIAAAVLAAVFLIAFKLVLGAEVSYKQCLAVVAWSLLAFSLVSSPLSLLTLYLKGDWNVSPDEALATNLGALLEQETAPRPLYALASSIDLFSFWLLFLLASGFGAAARKGTAWAAPVVIGLWVAYVVVKAGFAAI